jgi:hypothetical protein
MALQPAGAAVELAPFTGEENQLWKIDQLTDGSYRIASKGEKLALAATLKTRPGTGISLEAFNGNEAERWQIITP